MLASDASTIFRQGKLDDAVGRTLAHCKLSGTALNNLSILTSGDPRLGKTFKGEILAFDPPQSFTPD